MPEEGAGAPGPERLEYGGRPGKVRGMLDKQRLGTFVLGGMAGILAGILLAPKSGKELRSSISSRAGEARERGRETYFEAQELMRERISEARESSFGPREIRTEGVADPPPKLGADARGPVLGFEPPADAPSPSPLRDVSQDVFPPTSGEDPDPEEIRRKIQETRSRLRARLDAPEDRDDG
jgi:YtxH-like protein